MFINIHTHNPNSEYLDILNQIPLKVSNDEYLTQVHDNSVSSFVIELTIKLFSFRMR